MLLGKVIIIPISTFGTASTRKCWGRLSSNPDTIPRCSFLASDPTVATRVPNRHIHRPRVLDEVWLRRGEAQLMILGCWAHGAPSAYSSRPLRLLRLLPLLIGIWLLVGIWTLGCCCKPWIRGLLTPAVNLGSTKGDCGIRSESGVSRCWATDTFGTLIKNGLKRARQKVGWLCACDGQEANLKSCRIDGRVDCWVNRSQGADTRNVGLPDAQD